MKLDRGYLKERTDEILRSATSPEFLAQLEEVRSAPKEQRIDEAAKRLTPDAMRKAGVNLPEGVRISSRYFEEGEDFDIELGDIGGRIAIVPALNQIQPGFLDRLRGERPDLFKQLVGHPYLGPSDLSVCVCVGAGPCLGIGGGD